MSGGAPPAVNEVLRTAEILRSGALFVGSDPRLTAIVERAQHLFGTEMAALTIVHAEWQHVIAAQGTTPGTYPRSQSFCAHAILRPQEVFCIPDATTDARFRDNPAVTAGDRIRFYAGAPLLSGRQALGALCVFDPVARPCLDTKGAASLQALASEAMAIIAMVARANRA